MNGLSAPVPASAGEQSSSTDSPRKVPTSTSSSLSAPPPPLPLDIPSAHHHHHHAHPDTPTHTTDTPHPIPSHPSPRPTRRPKCPTHSKLVHTTNPPLPPRDKRTREKEIQLSRTFLDKWILFISLLCVCWTRFSSTHGMAHAWGTPWSSSIFFLLLSLPTPHLLPLDHELLIPKTTRDSSSIRLYYILRSCLNIHTFASYSLPSLSHIEQDLATIQALTQTTAPPPHTTDITLAKPCHFYSSCLGTFSGFRHFPVIVPH